MSEKILKTAAIEIDLFKEEIYRQKWEKEQDEMWKKEQEEKMNADMNAQMKEDAEADIRALELNSGANMNWYKKASDEEGTITTEISAEEMISNHFAEVLKLMGKRVIAFKDEEERKSIYKELISTVDGILKVLKEIEGDEKSKIAEILKGFKQLANEKFKDLLAKDLEEIKKGKENPPETEAPPSAEGLPPPQTQPIEEDPLPQVAAFRRNPILRLSSVKNLSEDREVKEDMLWEYAKRICKAVENCGIEHIADIDLDNDEICLIDDKGEKIVTASFNENLLLNGLSSSGKYSDIYPVSSLDFYQRFFKPMVESLGHYLIEDLDVLFLPENSSLPNKAKTACVSKLKGFDMTSKKDVFFELNFVGSPLTWVFKHGDKINKTAQTTQTTQKKVYTEEDFLKGSPIRVKCTDVDLASVFGKIGEVVQVIPCSDHIELDINFGRKIVRLTTLQIEKIDEI